MSDERTDWKVSCPNYEPTCFTHTAVLNNDREKKTGGWADPSDVRSLRAELEARLTFEGPIIYDETTGEPLNPRGRTGLRGRGLLGKWGANHAADPIVTRWDPNDRIRLQMVAIQRKDTGQWAIPGGMVDPGESVSATVRREFEEEAGAFDEPATQAEFRKMCGELFANEEIVYQGYVDDPRNTDHAWIETTAMHFHCSDELGPMLRLKAGDDAGDVKWLDVDMTDPTHLKFKWGEADIVLYADHCMFVQTAVQRMVAAAVPQLPPLPPLPPLPQSQVETPESASKIEAMLPTLPPPPVNSTGSDYTETPPSPLGLESDGDVSGAVVANAIEMGVEFSLRGDPEPTDDPEPKRAKSGPSPNGCMW